MRTLLKDIVDSNEWDGVEVYSDYIDPYSLPSSGEHDGYHVLKFYAGDDMEVDPDQWVVVYEDDEIEIMNNKQFNTRFEEIR
jgi:hypothetical protein